MEYVLLRYKHRPEDLVGVVATANPSVAVDLVRRWSKSAPDEGLIVTIDKQAIVHCTPRGR